MNNNDRINKLKSESKNHHIHLFYQKNNKIRHADIVTNKDFITNEIDKEWKDSNISYIISGFDYVTMTFVNINTRTIIWDEISGFYDDVDAYQKSVVNKCNDTLRFIGTSSMEVLRKKFNLNKFSKRKNPSHTNFTFNESSLNNGCDFIFDDKINGEHYFIVIPHSFVDNNKKMCREKTTRRFLCWMLSEQAILTYIESLDKSSKVNNK